MSIFVAFRKEWTELLRTYRFLAVLVVLVFFGLFSPLIAKLTPELYTLIPGGEAVSEALLKLIPPPSVLDAVAQYVKNMGQDCIILALLLTMGAVAMEKDKGTASMILVKPMPRGAFINAKFLAMATMFAICLVSAGIACYYYTLLLFEAMDILHWLVLNAFLLLYVLVYVAITLFCSTISKSWAVAGGTALGMIALLGLIGVIPSLAKYLPGELIAWGVRLMQGDTSSSWSALGISLGLIVLSLLAAWLVFKKQEL